MFLTINKKKQKFKEIVIYKTYKNMRHTFSFGFFCHISYFRLFKLLKKSCLLEIINILKNKLFLLKYKYLKCWNIFNSSIYYRSYFSFFTFYFKLVFIYENSSVFHSYLLTERKSRFHFKKEKISKIIFLNFIIYIFN